MRDAKSVLPVQASGKPRYLMIGGFLGAGKTTPTQRPKL
jgi:hypothetical protein